MATLVKLRGTDRGDSPITAPATTSGSVGPSRGFRLPSGFGLQYPSGVKATATGGATTNGLTVTAKYGGTWANGHTFTYAAGGANSNFSLAVTFAAGTGVPTYTYTAGTVLTVAQIAAALNANPAFSQFYTAAPLTTGAGTTPVSPGALASGTNVGTGQTINVILNNRSTAIVDIDDALTARMVRRNPGRFISLGQA
jgi:hypothetical protein